MRVSFVNNADKNHFKLLIIRILNMKYGQEKLVVNFD